MSPSKFSQIEGWSDEGIFKVYERLLSECKDGDIIIEVGSWKGKSALWLLERALELKKEPMIYFVDLWSGCAFGSTHDKTSDGMDTSWKIGNMHQEFLNNIKNAGFDNINSMVSDSHEASNRFQDDSIFSIFFDGNHQQDYCLKEIELWKPKVRKGGVIAGHDYPQMGFVNRVLPGLEDCGSCYFWRKP